MLLVEKAVKRNIEKLVPFPNEQVQNWYLVVYVFFFPYMHTSSSFCSQDWLLQLWPYAGCQTRLEGSWLLLNQSRTGLFPTLEHISLFFPLPTPSSTSARWWTPSCTTSLLSSSAACSCRSFAAALPYSMPTRRSFSEQTRAPEQGAAGLCAHCSSCRLGAILLWGAITKFS